MGQLLDSFRFFSKKMVILAAFTLRDLAYIWRKDVYRAKKIRYASEGYEDPGMKWDECTTLFHE